MVNLFVLTTLCALATHGMCETPEAFYKREMGSKVVPKFTSAVNIYKTNILQKLAAVTPAQIRTTANVIVKQLNCDVKRLSGTLKSCVTGCDSVRTQVDKKLQNAVSEESKLQQNIGQLQSQQRADENKLKNLQSNLRQAEQQEAAARTSLSNAEAELRRQNKRLDDARNNCVGRRRRRRGLGSFLKKVIKAPERLIRKTVLKPVEKLVCRTFNRGGIRNADHGRNLAQNNLNNAHNRVVQLRKQVNDLKNKVNTHKTGIANLNRRLTATKDQANALKAKRQQLTAVTTKVKAATTRVSTFLGRSRVFSDAVQNMVMFDDVVQPMNAVTQHLKQVNIQTPTLNVSPAVASKMVANLQALKSRLPEFPFVDTATC